MSSPGKNQDIEHPVYENPAAVFSDHSKGMDAAKSTLCNGGPPTRDSKVLNMAVIAGLMLLLVSFAAMIGLYFQQQFEWKEGKMQVGFVVTFYFDKWKFGRLVFPCANYYSTIRLHSLFVTHYTRLMVFWLRS